jgi:hypothetical protein
MHRDRTAVWHRANDEGGKAFGCSPPCDSFNDTCAMFEAQGALPFGYDLKC